jgi:hypothetical protein
VHSSLAQDVLGVKASELVITHISEYNPVTAFPLNRKERKGCKEPLFLIFFALFAYFAVRCG